MPDFGVDRVGVPCERRGCVVVSATPGSKLNGLSVAPGDSCQGGAPDRGHHCFRDKRHHPRRKSDGFVRGGANMILHIDVFKAALPKDDAFDGPLGARTTKQMSLDLEDLW